MRSTSSALLLVGFLAAACGGSDPAGGGNPPPPPPPPPAGAVVITLTAALQFSPSEVTISAGTPVRWVYESGPAHTITPRDAGQAGVWARQAMNTVGQTFDHTFNVAGQTYDYFCEPHELQGMTGRIIVQ